MRRVTITCDLCGRELKEDSHRYAVLKRDIVETFLSPEWEWKQIDVCQECIDKIIKRV